MKGRLVNTMMEQIMNRELLDVGLVFKIENIGKLIM
jgi:hypothetical protein